MQNIQMMFQSATLKLTIWFLFGVMLLSIVFSTLLYNFATSELGARFEVVETKLEQDTHLLEQDKFDFKSVREREVVEAEHNIISMLIYTNAAVFGLASIGSYLMARRTLRPIEAAHEAQARFTSDASHELRTPLAVMKTELEVILRDKDAKKSDYQEILASNLEEVDRLSTLSSTLLKLAKLDDGAMVWHEFNMTESIDTAIKLLGQEGERVDVLATKKLPRLTANNESITELIVILLDNALKYSPPKSRVEISLRRRTNRLELAVTNSGKGIEPEFLPHIFTRFYRLDTSRTKQATPGYGLGLSLAKKIVELHRGELTASSKPGDFTRFVIRLPFSQS